MIRVIPSQIVSVIEKLFPAVFAEATFQLKIDDTAALTALLALVDQVPQELFPATSEPYNDLMIALATLRNAPYYWTWQPRVPIVTTPGGYSKNPVRLLYEILKECPDEAAAPETTDLLFIADPKFRTALRLDLSSANQALTNGEWKAATVLAGSIVEALLLWAIQQREEADYHKALKDAVAKKNVGSPRYSSLEKWDLVHYIAVAEELQQISADIATLARLTKDFRNLIHPGRVQRTSEACSRGTAMTALGAVERVIEHFTAHF